jgi:hypothetical protein
MFQSAGNQPGLLASIQSIDWAETGNSEHDENTTARHDMNHSHNEKFFETL